MARTAALTLLVPLVATGVFLTSGAPAAVSAPPQQSPIDIVPSAVHYDPSAPALTISYGTSAVDLSYIQKDGNCAARNEEETEQAAVTAGAAYVTYAGTRYDLAQFHFHTPSEHSINGQHDPLEMHLVHRSAAGAVLVIGVPLRVGTASTVDTVLGQLVPECGTPHHINTVNLNSLLPANHTTARYTGSLTTAPFTEPVLWFLMPEQHATSATITAFKTLFHNGNSRPTQPLNGRTVTLHP